MTLSQSYQRLFESFNSEQVRYLVVGGYAVILHGHPRMTKDLDLWIDNRSQNAELCARVLRDLDYLIPPTIESQLQGESQLVVLGELPNRIDLLTSIPGFSFKACYDRRSTSHLGGIEVPLVSLPDLRALKKAAGRFQDLADLENLPEV